MEIKKNPKVDVNNKRTVLLEIGLCLALLCRNQPHKDGKYQNNEFLIHNPTH